MRPPVLPCCLGIDHVVVGVSDLPWATRCFRSAGFTVVSGGHHPGLGTHNALVALRSGYIELLAIENVAGEAPHPSLAPLARRTARSDGLVGWAIESDDLAALARCLRSRRVEPLEATEGCRVRPVDGKVIEWRMLTIGGGVLGQALPFAIEWRTPLDERITPTAAAHPNTASRLVGIRVRVKDNTLPEKLGLRPIPTRRAAEIDAVRSRYALGRSTLDVVVDQPGSQTAREIQEFGEGVCGITLAVHDLDAFPLAEGSDELSICGTPLRLVQEVLA